MLFFDYALAEKQTISQKIAEAMDNLAQFPRGSLLCYKNGKRFKYYHEISNSSSSEGRIVKYLGKKDLETITKLAQKSVWKSRLRELRLEQKALQAYLDIHEVRQDVALNTLRRSERLKRIINTEMDTFRLDDVEWSKQEYEHNPNHQDQLVVKIRPGESVRSKSEAFIATALRAHNIPYRYECRFPINYPAVYPDFTFLHPVTQQEMIWEHFGLMDDPEYVKSMTAKLKLYIENGYLPNRRLFMTFESGSEPFGYEEANWLIENVIM